MISGDQLERVVVISDRVRDAIHLTLRLSCDWFLVVLLYEVNSTVHIMHQAPL
jgi:hypothetical protein